MDRVSALASQTGASFYFYGFTSGIIFCVALFFLIFAGVNFFIRKRAQVARMFLYGMVAHLSYTFFNVYGLLVHFEPAREAFPEWLMFLGKIGIPVGLYMNFKVLLQTTPIHSEEAFALWHKAKPVLRLIDIIYLMVLTAIIFINDYKTVLILGFSIALIHCMTGAMFALRVVKPKHVGQIYFGAMALLSSSFVYIILVLATQDLSKLSEWVFFGMHGISALLIMLCGFAIITFILETNLTNNTVSAFNIENLDKNIFQALRQKELFVVYQPKLNLKTKKITGFEALIRWQHGKKGLIQPNQFIPMIEKTPIINDVCHYMIDNIIADIDTFKAHKLCVPVSINFSVNNLNTDTANYLIKRIKENNLPSNAIMIEITESLFLELSESQKEALSLLKAAKIPLSLDDFGAGFSSLRHLDKLGLTELKLDKGITDNILDKTNKTVVANLINMCHELGIKVVAEGVEDKKTMITLMQIDCMIIQGFIISKPKSLEAIVAWYKQNTTNQTKKAKTNTKKTTD